MPKNKIKNIIKDLKEREEALDVTRSFIVQAPAGSGKTELLLQRLLSLLAHVSLPEEVLAITFTRKAAGEILARVIEALEKAEQTTSNESLSHNEIKTLTLAKAVMERDRKLGWNILDTPARLRIQTIDSLCSDITRQMPILGGGLQGALISEDCRDMYAEAVRGVTGLIEEESPRGDALRVVLKHLDNDVPALERRLKLMLSKRDQWMRFVGSSELSETDVFREFLEKSLSQVVSGMLDEVRSLLPEITHRDICQVASFAGSNVTDISISNLSGLKELPSNEEIDKWRGLRDLFMTGKPGKGGWRKVRGLNVKVGFPGGSKNKEVAEKIELMKPLLSEFELNEPLKEALDGVGFLPDTSYSDSEWEVLKNLLFLLKVSVEKLEDVFRENGKIDFQTVSMAALKALGSEADPTELLLAIDLKLGHILVDEYQDTSRSQTDLLKTLTSGWVEGDGRTLFIVGDPMQSIYHFREADVGLFIEAGGIGVGSVKLDQIVLKSNFRSHSAVVDWINDTFEKTFPLRDNSFLGSVTYSPSSPVISVPEKSNGDSDWINTNLYEDPDDESEALHIAEVVKDIHKTGRGETIAVLARARFHMMKIAGVFEEQKIPFVSEELHGLSNSPVVMDLMSLTAAINHPKDRLHWLAFLRSPLCGLTLADIHNIVLGKKTESVWQLLNEEMLFTGLSSDGEVRINRIKDKIEKAIKYRGRATLSRLIESLWLDLGGPASYEEDISKDSEEFFTALRGLDGEVFSLETLKAKVKELFTSSSLESSDPSMVSRVEFMTIHKAKGLEFDHVIVPGMGRGEGGGEKRLMLWMPCPGGLLMAPMDRKTEESKLYGFIKSLYKKKEFLEKTRLLYVAATRAKRGLYLFGHVKDDGEGVLKGSSKSFLSLIEHILEKDMIVGAAEGVEAVIEEDRGASLHKIKSGWKNPPPPMSVVSAISKDFRKGEASKLEFDWAGRATACLGSVLHLYFMRIAKEGLSNWNSKRIVGEEGVMKNLLIAQGLSSAEAGSRVKDGLKILKQAISDDRGKWVLSQSREAEVEKPVSYYNEGRVVRLVIDRTFVDDSDVRWIIDYKTGSHGGSRRDEFFEEEKKRYMAQLEKYEEALIALGEKRTIKKALYYPAMGEFIEL